MGQDTQEQGTRLHMTGQVPMYRKPEPLNYGLHGKLGIKRDGDALGFLKGTNYCLVVAGEFYQLCRHYPIIFAGEEHAPIAIMGLKEGQNAFVREDGTYEPYAYVPAFIRRYPFVLANSAGQEQSIVCIDRAYELIGEDAETPFFVNGEPSEDTKRSMEFLQLFESDRKLTQELVKIMKDYDLFADMTATYNEQATATQPARSTPIASYRGVPQEKLDALDGKALKDLRDRGVLGMIIAHQISLQNWTLVMHRSMERGWLDGTPLQSLADRAKEAADAMRARKS